MKRKIDRDVFEMMKVVLRELIRMHAPAIRAEGFVSRELLGAAHRAADNAVTLCMRDVRAPAPTGTWRVCDEPLCEKIVLADSDFCGLHQG